MTIKFSSYKTGKTNIQKTQDSVNVWRVENVIGVYIKSRD